MRQRPHWDKHLSIHLVRTQEPDMPTPLPRGIPGGNYAYLGKIVTDDWLRRAFGAQENWRP